MDCEDATGVSDDDDDVGTALGEVVVTDERVTESEEITDEEEAMDEVGATDEEAVVDEEAAVDGEEATVGSDSLIETGIGSLSTVLGGRDTGDSRVDGTNRGLDSGRLGIVPMVEGGLLLDTTLIRSLSLSSSSCGVLEGAGTDTIEPGELVVGELTVGDLVGGRVALGILELGKVRLGDFVLGGHNSAV